MRLIHLLLSAFLFTALLTAALWAASAASDEDDEDDDNDGVRFNDFTLFPGDRVEIGDYRVEMVQVQSMRDGLVLVRVIGDNGRDEQRLLLLNSANNINGGSEDGGLTITALDAFEDGSAKIRIESPEKMGNPRKRTGDRKALAARDNPQIDVRKSFDSTAVNVGENVKATIIVQNRGTGTASEITVMDLPPIPEFSYVAGYPPKIKEKLEPGESDSAAYVMTAVKEGAVAVPAIDVRYKDSKGSIKTNSSEAFTIIIHPRKMPDIDILLGFSGPISVGEVGMLNVSIMNRGQAPAQKVEVTGKVEPAGSLDIAGLERTFFEIAPGSYENYTAQVTGKGSGKCTINLLTSFRGGEALILREKSLEIDVLEREYKYLYYLIVLPVVLIGFWVVKRYREYKY